MGDGAAEGALGSGADGIGMDELMVVGRMGKSVDHRLIDNESNPKVPSSVPINPRMSESEISVTINSP